MIKFIFIFIILFLCKCILNATIINVPSDQPTIQAGIDSATTGDTVLVQPGLYIENINFNGKNIIVSSLYLINNDTSFISQTIIDGDSHDSVVKFMNSEDSTATLIGFTLQRGLGQEFPPPGLFYFGGGIYCKSSNPTLRNLIITQNTFTSEGGGVYYDSSKVRIFDTTIKDNFVNAIVGGSGGGILLVSSTGTIENVIFKNNKSNGIGGAIAIFQSNISLKNVLFVENYSYSSGAAIVGGNSNFILQNVTSINNTAAVSGGGIHCIDDTHVKVINSIFWNDSPNIIDFHVSYSPNSLVALHSNIEGGLDSIQSNNNGSVHWLDGNIDLDPQFMDTSTSNYNLNATSPCIDAGIQDTIIVYNNDLDTMIIPTINFLGTAPDMGAYEFDPATNIDNEPKLAEYFFLFQNFPNPFNPTTTIKYTLPKSDRVTIEVFNLLGQKITTLLDKQIPAGKHEVKFTADNLTSGIYLYRIQAGEYQEVRKMVLIK